MRKFDLIALDMDGVLVDLFQGLTSLMNDAYPEIEPWTKENWPKGEYGMAEFYDVHPKEMWDLVARKPDFWYELKALPWAKDLYRICKERAKNGNVIVLTAPVMDPDCFRQKYQWLRDFGIPHKMIMIGTMKEFLAQPSRLLVDDSEKNCQYWRNNNGLTLLFPCEQNRNHQYVSDPLAYVNHVMKVYDDALTEQDKQDA